MTKSAVKTTANEEVATAGKRSYSVPAAEKALDVLEFMASQSDGMTVTESMRRAGELLRQSAATVLRERRKV